MPSFRLIAGIAALFAAGAVLQWLHPLAQPASYHRFADARALGPVQIGRASCRERVL